MNATMDRPDAPSLESIDHLVHQWLSLYDNYRLRERRQIIEREPDPRTLTAYRSELKLLLRSARALQIFVSDPDFPDPALSVEVDGKLLQLQSSWEAVNNSLSDDEADTLLKAHFPDEPRAGSPA